MSTARPRPLRADAQKNRDAIVSAARTVFARDGILAPLDGIAVTAGVGNATLYRNFPTKEDLLAAVMVDSVRETLDRSDELERLFAADDALREWLFLLTWQLRMWHDLPGTIATAIGDFTSPVQDVCGQLTARTGDFLDRARTAGSAVEALAPRQLFELVTAISWAADRFGDDEECARARVALATAGAFTASAPRDSAGAAAS